LLGLKILVDQDLSKTCQSFAERKEENRVKKYSVLNGITQRRIARITIGKVMKPMSERENIEASEAQIAVHWQEEGYYHPSAEFIAQANMPDPDMDARFSLDNFPHCFKEYADLLTWYEYWHTMLDTSDPPSWKWFVGGKINASYNCIDRHLPKYRNKAAIIYVPEPESEPHVTLTYQELYNRVNEVAHILRDFAGLKAGDRVTLHLPMVLELPITMLACARLGVIHSVVFGGFSGKSCGERIADSGSRVLITIDGYYRASNLLDQKAKSDEAIQTAEEEGQAVDKSNCGRRGSSCR
jgi:acetyl-CoA synthetase